MVELIPLDRFNWEEISELKVRGNQRDFMPENVFSIAQSRFEESELFGVYEAGRPVGFVMYCNFNRMCWVNRIMIDAEFQGQGLGLQALMQLLERLDGHPACAEIRTSFSPANAGARALFTKAGFAEISSLEDEVVMRWESA